MTKAKQINFENSYAQLPERFFSSQAAEPVAAPAGIRVNHQLARELGIDPDWLASAQGTNSIAGNEIPAGAQPIATAYAGHQFGGWNPQLGDGRAVLLGEVITPAGERFDLQLKGSGRTPYSRGGDGRAPLGPVLREYIVSEAMATLGVPTTRALAAVTTGELVYRERALPGAVLARVARSHIRIGTFQFFAARGDTEALQILSNHVIQRHYPEAASAENPVAAMLEAVVKAQAALVARWQALGFIHGVMNTDNMLLSGETIDYGPCAFMDSFNPDTVFSSIDHQGRYAYRNQPGIAHWNLSCLAEALLPILDPDSDRAVTVAQAAIDQFPDCFLAAHASAMGDKLGLNLAGEADETLLRDLLELMAETEVDFTLCFRRLADLAGGELATAGIEEVFELPAAFQPWLERWQARAAQEPVNPAQRLAQMYAANPVFIPRNHLVEEVIRAAEDNNDFTLFDTLMERLATPGAYHPEWARYALPPRPEQVVRQTFCGT
jgi:uncharacterized protein YdiU (UPF0061 family)